MYLSQQCVSLSLPFSTLLSLLSALSEKRWKKYPLKKTAPGTEGVHIFMPTSSLLASASLL